MTFSELQKQVEVDLILEPHNFEAKLYTIPVMHSNYLRIYHVFKKKYQNLMLEMDNLYRTKWHGYSTEGCDGHKLKTQKEIIIYIEGDTEILNKRIKLDDAKRKMEYMSAVVDKVSKLSFDIKNIIEHTKWINGGQA